MDVELDRLGRMRKIIEAGRRLGPEIFYLDVRTTEIIGTCGTIGCDPGKLKNVE
jgi:hypothetical protein